MQIIIRGLLNRFDRDPDNMNTVTKSCLVGVQISNEIPIDFTCQTFSGTALKLIVAIGKHGKLKFDDCSPFCIYTFLLQGNMSRGDI